MAEWGDAPNTEIHNVAISNRDGDAVLRCPDDELLLCCHLVGLYAPAVYNTALSMPDRVHVQCRRFRHYDDGTIDFLLCDCEGAEWLVIEDMASRPKAIQLELVLKKGYRNPHLGDIEAWMKSEGYRLQGRQLPGKDWLYVRN